MSDDIICRKCGEPWDSYGVHHRMDMDEEEAQRFLRGEGCPCCDFGAKCPMCRGTGYEDCPRCFGLGELPTHHAGQLCDHCPPSSQLASWTEIIGRCPAPKNKTCDLCNGSGRNKSLICGRCAGIGKPTGEHFEKFLSSLVDSSDEDPIALINNVTIGQQE